MALRQAPEPPAKLWGGGRNIDNIPIIRSRCLIEWSPPPPSTRDVVASPIFTSNEIPRTRLSASIRRIKPRRGRRQLVPRVFWVRLLGLASISSQVFRHCHQLADRACTAKGAELSLSWRPIVVPTPVRVWPNNGRCWCLATSQARPENSGIERYRGAIEALAGDPLKGSLTETLGAADALCRICPPDTNMPAPPPQPWRRIEKSDNRHNASLAIAAPGYLFSTAAV